MKTKIINSIQTNLDGVNLFNYNERVVQTVLEVCEISKHNTSEQKKELMSILSEVLHNALFDTYEEIMRDEEVWNRYFDNVLKTIPPILKIDKKYEGKIGQNVEKNQY